MNLAFIKRHAVFLFPVIFIMVWFIQARNYNPSDWLFHIVGTQTEEYPFLSPFLAHIFFRAGLIAAYVSVLFLALPYILILAITKDERYALAYVYLSGIPWTLAWGGFFGQAIIQVLMLFNLLLGPIAWPFTILIGLETHREAIGALGLSMVIWAVLWFRGIFRTIRLPYEPQRGVV